jgi:AcrR family transcriptional regulator
MVRTMASKRKSYHHGDLRTSLIEKAIRLLSERAGPFFTMRELSSDLGVSHTAAYRHFKDKEALLRAIAIEGFIRLGEFQQKGLSVKSPPLARLMHLGVSYVKFALSYPSHFRVMFGPVLSDRKETPELATIAQKTFVPVVEEVRKCQDAKKLVSGNPEEIALTLWASVHGLSMLLIDGQVKLATGDAKLTSDRLIETVTETIMRGFRKN